MLTLSQLVSVLLSAAPIVTSIDVDQTASCGTVLSWSILVAYTLSCFFIYVQVNNFSVMSGQFLIETVLGRG